MGDDSDAERENLKAKNELLDAEASLEVKREEEEALLKKEERKKQVEEVRHKAMMLTEENLKLKKQLEEQRANDARESRDFQRRIIQEEKKRQEILANLEKQRIERERKKNDIMTQLEQDKLSRLADLRQSHDKFKERQDFAAEQNRKKQEALFQAKRKEIEKEYGDKILNTQLERKHTGLVEMNQKVLSEEAVSNLVSDDTRMKIMSSPIKDPPSHLGQQENVDVKSHITGQDMTSINAQTELNLKSQPDIRPPLSPIPKDSDARSGQQSPLTGQQHLSMLHTADELS